MPSIRELAECIGLRGDISIVRDFLGFWRGELPPDPVAAPVQISLLRQAERLQGRHFHLNVIAVGSDLFGSNDNIAVDYSIFRIRDIYDQVQVGVGRVEHYRVLSADAGGLDAPTTRDQLETITNRWTIPNDGIDVFITRQMTIPSDGGVVLGRSPRPGPCEEKDDKGMNGSVVGPWDSDQMARTFAHEVGHYLGLEHRNNQPENLMAQGTAVQNAGLPVHDAVELTNGQGNDIRDHCLMKSGC